MDMFQQVDALWEHQDGNLTDAQETELFKALIDGPVWPKLNKQFQERVKAKLEAVKPQLINS